MSPAKDGRGLLLGFPDYADPARNLAAAAGLDYAEIAVHRFPDGESRIRLPAQLPGRVVICRSLYQPNHKLIELALAAATARELGAKHLTLAAPYLCYMRQDKAFHPGEAVSQRVVGKFLASHFDALITVDPHLHRVSRLGDAMPARSAVALAATDAMAAYLDGRLDNPLLIGPDAESRQWVAAISRRPQGTRGGHRCPRGLARSRLPGEARRTGGRHRQHRTHPGGRQPGTWETRSRQRYGDGHPCTIYLRCVGTHTKCRRG